MSEIRVPVLRAAGHGMIAASDSVELQSTLDDGSEAARVHAASQGDDQQKTDDEGDQRGPAESQSDELQQRQHQQNATHRGGRRREGE